MNKSIQNIPQYLQGSVELSVELMNFLIVEIISPLSTGLLVEPVWKEIKYTSAMA